MSVQRKGGVQDRYTGDIGDFGKYGLLKALSGSDLSLGIVWYLFPDEGGSGDGSHIGYLEPAPRNVRRFRNCDPDLYDTLGEIVGDGVRGVRSVREYGVLPPRTTFYEETLSFEDMPSIGSKSARARLDRRKAWAWDALSTTRGCDIVFADPDNGLEGGTMRHHRRGPKFAYFDELAPYSDRGQSLVIYHHLHRGASADKQVHERLSQITERLGDAFALLYRRGNLRAFFVVPTEAHKGMLFERANGLMNGPWSEHFTLAGTTGT